VNFDPDDDPMEEVPPKPKAAPPGGVRLEDFVAYMQSHDYVYLPAGDFWPAARVNARLPPVPLKDKAGKPVINKTTGLPRTTKASAWLARHAPVEQMTWAPGLPQLVRDKLIGEGGWIDRKGVTCSICISRRRLSLVTRPRPSLGLRT
jgi:hypothetical protein